MTVRLALVVLCALAGARAYACAGLGVEHAWLREPPPGTSMAAAYFDLVNRGLQAVHITALASADFGSAMLHTTQIIEGRAQMRVLETVELVPGARFSAAPGGAHLMLGDPHRPLRAGDSVSVTITCASGTPLEFTLPVARIPPP